jgi:hypothetical protein
MKPLYLFQNPSPSNLKGEQWKNIPGLEGYFRISNIGRVKRLHYKKTCTNGVIRTYPERIIKPGNLWYYNAFMKDYLYFTTVKMKLNGVNYAFMISRLVYYCFVEKFDMDDYKHTYIINKDNNTLNILPRNLKKSSRSDILKRIYERGPCEKLYETRTQRNLKKVECCYCKNPR